MKALLVDWLGRGGIAQTTAAWAEQLAAHGAEVVVVTRGGRELDDTTLDVRSPSRERNRLVAHRAIASLASRITSEERPDVVLVQNYIVPVLEGPVFTAGRRAGSRVVAIIHDHRLHSRWAGTSTGLTRNLARCDSVLAHSRFVADEVQRATRRTVEVVALPVPVLPPAGRLPVHDLDHSKLLAVSFGILHRTYKASDVVVAVAGSHPPGWQFALLGAGAPESADAAVVNRFVDGDELAATLDAADVAMLPYRYATQSAALLLAQAHGAIPVTTRVGALPEQVEDGVDGRLLAVDAPISEWRAVLEELRDPHRRAAMTCAARARAERQRASFADDVTSFLESA